jgi:hypothetical protein
VHFGSSEPKAAKQVASDWRKRDFTKEKNNQLQ